MRQKDTKQSASQPEWLFAVSATAITLNRDKIFAGIKKEEEKSGAKLDLHEKCVVAQELNYKRIPR